MKSAISSICPSLVRCLDATDMDHLDRLIQVAILVACCGNRMLVQL